MGKSLNLLESLCLRGKNLLSVSWGCQEDHCCGAGPFLSLVPGTPEALQERQLLVLLRHPGSRGSPREARALPSQVWCPCAALAPLWRSSSGLSFWDVDLSALFCPSKLLTCCQRPMKLIQANVLLGGGGSGEQEESVVLPCCGLALSASPSLGLHLSSWRGCRREARGLSQSSISHPGLCPHLADKFMF